jgi:tRNA threonylcarbamoyladenosine modification (KEOPS) complex Cgi121 subunit
MNIDHYAQTLPEYVKIRCFSLSLSRDGTQSDSLWPDDLLESLAGPTRFIDPETKVLMAPDGSCTRLCFGVNLDLVWDELHLRGAIYRALYNMNSIRKLKTKSLPAEVLYQLASTGKINESIKQFSIKDCSKTIAVISLAQECAEFEELCRRILELSSELPNVVSGVEEIALSELCANLGSSEKRALISKVFKTSPAENLAPDFSQMITMRLAMKDIEN